MLIQPTEELAPREEEFLRAFLRVYDQKRSAPTIREMCAATGLKSNASAYRFMSILSAKGWLERLPQGKYVPSKGIRP